MRALRVAVGSQGHHVCALLATEKVRCWGRDSAGALGLASGKTGDQGDDPGEIEALEDLPLD